ncbi:carbohydrate ABC transporter permease [Micromonospora cathayae]|uniref:Carbohydrate ABC transporter permease n=1 Tax=Micromonospora cathayae TaxID=3028804 RepID=A0ABY7ZJC3_9ACTN|nr:carbohydrate ABC transporter permease [Micromonospora sp. HUAS 3]WDZ83050.1 carbohydrate ABC transporter permease [Micromonospora sp. HUAS 3]
MTAVPSMPPTPVPPSPTGAAPGGGPDRAGSPGRRRRSGVNWWLTALMVVCSLTVLVPLYFTVVTALKSPEDLGGAGFAPPTDPRWANFADAWRLTDFPHAALNSALITVGAVLLTLLTNSMVAYAIARNMHRRMFRWLYYYFVSALFVPFPIIMLPVVKQTAWLNLDNQLGLIFLYVVYGLAFNIFVYVGYLRSVPRELEEAALTDGAGIWTTFWRIVFPLLAPMNATVGILTCLWAWNDFLLPLVILSSPDAQTLPLVQYVFQGQFDTNYTVAFASYLMALSPLVVVYLLAQRWVISGVMRGSVK